MYLTKSPQRRVEPELFPCLRKFGLSFYAFNPLGGGFFTGKYKPSPDAPIEAGARFDPNRQQGKFYRSRYWNDYYFKALEIVQIPERVLQFRVVWEDDQGQPQVNRGYRVQVSTVVERLRTRLRRLFVCSITPPWVPIKVVCASTRASTCPS